MLKAKKKLVKKEIKEDTLVKLSSQATTLYYDNKRYVNYALAGLAVVVVAIVMYVNNRRQNDEKATSELSRILSIYEAGAGDPAQYSTAIEGEQKRGLMGLKAIVDNYGNSDAGETARFYLANAYYFTGRYDEALTQYDKFSGSSPILRGAAYAGMGGCYETKKEFAKAASEYERAAGIATGTGSTPEYLASAARCYGISGDKEKAVTLYKRIKKEFPTSAVARDADRYIAQFSA